MPTQVSYILSLKDIRVAYTFATTTFQTSMTLSTSIVTPSALLQHVYFAMSDESQAQLPVSFSVCLHSGRAQTWLRPMYIRRISCRTYTFVAKMHATRTFPPILHLSQSRSTYRLHTRLLKDMELARATSLITKTPIKEQQPSFRSKAADKSGEYSSLFFFMDNKTLYEPKDILSE